jgi:hypothetical protein
MQQEYNGPLLVCRSCGARIRFAETEKGRRMPIDVKPSENGNVQLIPGVKGPVAIVLGGQRLEEFRKSHPTWPLFTSHFATCVSAEKYRQRVKNGSSKKVGSVTSSK